MAGASTATKFMSARSFFDTNILIYADDETDPIKQRLAAELFADHRRRRSGVVSLQILQEYFVVATRKFGIDAGSARRKVELIAELTVVTPEVSDILAAIDLHRLHAFSFWDALILQSAKLAGCSVLFSEDFQHEQRIEGLRIVNPFR
jgi:predicted nucleic acid-binding protein